MDEIEAARDDGEAWKEGEYILDGRYRIIRLLYQRPRLNLYLGRRVSLLPRQSDTVQSDEEPLVAIRELVLTGLSPQVRAQVEAAAFEEFVSPVVLGSPRLSTAGDRVWVEDERHYLVMQLHETKREEHTLAVTLEDLLLSHRQWPGWLHIGTVLNWGTQLCRIVARLHRLGVVLGDLNPATILVDEEGVATWVPVLLVSWPPAPQFWQVSSTNFPALILYHQIFPIANGSLSNTFVSPEILTGVCDERSDVYSLGAILYLLFTEYAPIAAARRLRAAQHAATSAREEQSISTVLSGLLDEAEGIELIPPLLLNRHLSSRLERVLLRALELDPTRRYSSVFALVEALEAILMT